jgi:hypothetical protein
VGNIKTSKWRKTMSKKITQQKINIQDTIKKAKDYHRKGSNTLAIGQLALAIQLVNKELQEEIIFVKKSNTIKV